MTYNQGSTDKSVSCGTVTNYKLFVKHLHKIQMRWMSPVHFYNVIGIAFYDPASG